MWPSMASAFAECCSLLEAGLMAASRGCIHSPSEMPLGTGIHKAAEWSAFFCDQGKRHSEACKELYRTKRPKRKPPSERTIRADRLDSFRQKKVCSTRAVLSPRCRAVKTTEYSPVTVDCIAPPSPRLKTTEYSPVRWRALVVEDDDLRRQSAHYAYVRAYTLTMAHSYCRW